MDETRLAVLIDFENIAAGTEKEGLGRFDVDALMGRIKDKGRILVARSYADWGRFARFKQALLAANVTMMELTSHGMQDKNRADIAMVVDCLELAFTKDYIDTFIIVSGDSDFTPLVLKMRELDKRVIGIGTRGSTSRLLIQACDEFVFYDSVAKRRERRQRTRPQKAATANTTAAPGSADPFDALVEALEGLQREHPDPAHASVVKQAILRKHPDFSESDHGFSSFARFLEAAQEKGLIKVLRDRKSGGYRVDSADSTATDDDDAAPAPREASPEALYVDEYTPEGAMDAVKALAALGLHPMSAPARLTVLEAIVELAAERKKKRRRVTVQFLTEDLKKRLRRTHPDLPGSVLKGLFDALMRADLLMHRDGTPIRRQTAPFGLDGKEAAQLNASLTELYLDLLADKTGAMDAGALAELFLGDADRKREIEETLAWLAARNDDDGADDGADGADDALLEVAADEDDDKPKKRRRRRGKKKDDEAPEAAAAPADDVDLDDLDALLAADDDDGDDAPAQSAADDDLDEIDALLIEDGDELEEAEAALATDDDDDVDDIDALLVED